jgi:AraC-like DNA-binding protein
MGTHSAILEFAQKAQTLGLVWLEADPVRLLSRVSDLILEIPRPRRDEGREAVTLILSRVAAALFRPERPNEWPASPRVHRAHGGHVHVTRAMNCIRREFANPALDLRGVANVCRLSPPYLSDLIASNTHHGFRVHLHTIRILHAAHLLATTPLSMKEVADMSGFKSTAALDHEFKRRFHMTPGQFRRWA